MHETQEVVEQKQDRNKYFDVFWKLDLKEAIGTFFLGLLSLILYKALRQSQARYEALLEHIYTGEKKQ
jgi:hypothetical protein